MLVSCKIQPLQEMNTTYRITRANYKELKEVQNKERTGSEVEYKDGRGKSWSRWVNTDCVFSDTPTGLQIEQSFATSGFKINVSPENRGTFTLIQMNVTSARG